MRDAHEARSREERSVSLIPRVSGLSEALFIENHLKASAPVIVTDAMSGWRALREWGPEYFKRKLGDMEVQVYDSLFTLVDMTDLASYLDRNFGQPPGVAATEYVRAYVRFKDVDITWADRLFDALSEDWGHPYFFPREAFALPGAPAGTRVSPVDSLFPYKGLFISGRGARTRLHRDPFGTEAMLCQFYGEKRLLFYEPHHADRLMKGGQFVDPLDVDRIRFPGFVAPEPKFDDVLKPGEILFIPSGWFHDVFTLSDSISITWNFAHLSSADNYRREVNNPANDFDRDMLSYLGGV